MRLLALDTSTSTASLAFLGGDGRIARSRIDPGTRHGQTLVPMIAELLRSTGCRPGDLDGVAVGLGPGSYTGLRIGITAAKTLAFASGARLLALDSLELVARNAPQDVRKITVISDAQRHDLYVADFKRDHTDAPLVRSGPTRFESQAS